METDFIAAAAIVILLAGAVAAGFAFGKMKTQIEHLREQLRRFSENQPKRHTHATTAGLEDATAVNLDLVHHIQQVRADLEALENRAEQQGRILTIVRQGPHSYDVDRPAGERPRPKPQRSDGPPPYLWQG